MRRGRLTLTILLASLCALASPLALTRTRDARQYLDRESAATITTMGRPFIFARERPSLAVNARDYISIVALDVNRAGQHQIYWYGYAWSTIDHRDQDAAPFGAPGWLMMADSRPVRLRTPAGSPADLGIVRPPLEVPARDARVVMFLADREVLGYVAAAGTLSLRSADGSEVFTLWRDARPELKALLKRREFQN